MARRALPLAGAACVLALLAGWLLHEALFEGRVLLAADSLLAYPPWSEVAPDDWDGPRNVQLLDQALVIAPWLEFAGREVRAGRLPLWNPHDYLGSPLLGANSGALLWPASFVSYAFPGRWYYGWLAFTRIVLAGVFTWLWLRRLGASAGAALVSALAFAFGGFLEAWMLHPPGNVALLLPALLWQIEGLVRHPGRRRAAGLALLVALVLLAGYAQAALLVLVACAAFCAARARWTYEGARLDARGLALAGCAAALGALLAAPQWLPFAEYISHSQAAWAFYELDMVGRVPFPEVAALMLDPHHWGAPHLGEYSGPTGPNLSYMELIGGYVGAWALLLALCGAAWGRPRRAARALALLAVVCAATAWQAPGFHALFTALPGLRSIKAARLLLFTGFALATLAGLGLDALLRRVPQRARTACALLAALGVAIELLSFARGFQPAVDPALVYPPTPVTDFLAAQPGTFRVLGVEPTTLMAGANMIYGLDTLAGYDSIEDRRSAELLLRLSNGAPDFPFVSRIPSFLRPGNLPLLSLLDVRYLLTVDPLPAPFVRVHDGQLDVWENPAALPRAFLANGARIVSDDTARLDALSHPDTDPRVVLLEHEPHDARFEAWRRAGFGQDGQAELHAYTPARIEVALQMDGPGLLVVSDAFDPGWTCHVDGRPREILRVDHALRGVLLEPGERTLVMSYAPRSFAWGLGLAAGAALVLLAMCVVPRRRPGPHEVR